MSQTFTARLLPPVTTDLCRQMQPTVYRYVWRVSASQQIRLCLLTLLIAPLSFIPLELQRRMVNDAIESPNVDLLLTLGAIYLVVLLLNSGLKYIRNSYQGVIAEGVVRILRKRVTQPTDEAETADGTSSDDNKEGEGARVSMAAAEADQLGGFVAESIATPLLEIATLVAVLGYMLFIEPLIALYTALLFVPVLIVVPRVQSAINRRVERRIDLMRDLGDEMTDPEDAGTDQAAQQTEFNELIENIYKDRVKIVLLRNFLKVFNRFFNNAGPLGVLLIGGILVIRGETEIGTIVAFMSGYDKLRAPSRELLSFYRLQSRIRTQFRLFRESVV